MFNWSNRFSALEDILVALDAWQDWVSSTDDTTLRDRVTWPLRAANLFDYPYINLSPGKASSRNIVGGYDSSANFQDSGTLQFRLWDNDANPDDPAASFDAFDANCKLLLDELIVASQSGPLIITAFEADEPAIVHSHDNAFILGEDADGNAFWHSSMSIFWGVP